MRDLGLVWLALFGERVYQENRYQNLRKYTLTSLLIKFVVLAVMIIVNNGKRKYMPFPILKDEFGN